MLGTARCWCISVTSMDNVERKRRLVDVGLLAVVALAGLALRWWRLDLISFRYDTAAAAFRARETLTLGHPPLTGIVNSHGFENAPGFIWLILPPFVFSPDMRWATAWHALLALSGLIPLFMIARGLLPRFVWVLPCAAFAFAPSLIAGARTIWAQNLLPSISAWCLLALYTLLKSESVTTRGRALVALTSLLLIGVSVHYSAGLWLLLSLPFAYVALRGISRRYFIMTAGVVAVGLLTFVPSALDWNYRQSHPLPKPEHVLQFESLMGDPEPALTRMRGAYAGLFEQLSSIAAASGVELDIHPIAVRAAGFADLALLALLLAGIAFAALQAKNDVADRRIAIVLLVWVLLPPAIAALLIKRVNGTYFAFAIPALVLVGGHCMKVERRRLARVAVLSIPVIIGMAFVAFWISLVMTVDRTRFARGQYYIPLVEQEKTAQLLRKEAIAPNTLLHLSGGWFQRPYEYLLAEHFGAKPARHADVPHAIMEDLYLRRNQPALVEFLENSMQMRVGSVGIKLFDNRREAEEYFDTFRSLPGEMVSGGADGKE